MKRFKELHHKAMEWAEKADLARIHGETAKAQSLVHKALELEKEAASLCPEDLEPTRSVLYRSAASLALQCKRIRDAEQLIATALAGNPHEEIANELRELMEQVWFERHLAVKGPVPSSNGNSIEVEGMLKFADDRKKQIIRVIADDKTEMKFIVPPGIMSHIVRPFWDRRVVVEGFLMRGAYHLKDIRAAKK
jgi:hypothetical protein